MYRPPWVAETMPEPEVESSRYRATLEWILRFAMLIALAFAIWQAVHALRQRPGARVAGGPSAVRTALARWSTVEAPNRGHVVLDSVPAADIRDWIAALPAAGTRTSWEGASLEPAAISVEPIVDPRSSVRVWVAAPSHSSLSISDSLGLIDSVAARANGSVVTVADINGIVRASVGGTTATAAQRDSVTVKPVLVIGVAGWEGKFVVASLEEHGWKAAARFGLAPTGDVTQGASGANIDTLHYSAVIAIDTAVAKYAAAITEFVRRGGGFIAAGDAAGLPQFAALLPATASAALPDAPFEADSVNPRRALALRPLVNLKPDAVLIEKLDANNAVAARRVGAGRVLQVGYLDTWRWRMGGFDDPLRAHRGWWSAMVSSVAYAPSTALAQNGVTDATPLSTLVSTLGPAAPQPPVRAGLANDPRLLIALFALILGALLIETASRRLRGKA
jgi:hypothetical protein